MKINENFFNSVNKGNFESKNFSLILKNKNISKIVLKNKIYQNIQYLSLESNNLIEIDFVSSFPFLWTLNLKKNPVILQLKKIGNFSPLKSLISLGFLAITLDTYSYNSFVTIRKINIGILEINEEFTFESLYLNQNQFNPNESYLPNDLNNKREIKGFVTIIPNILLVNNRIVYASQIFYNSFREGMIIKFAYMPDYNSNLKIRDNFNQYLSEWHKEFKLIQRDYSIENISKLFEDFQYRKIERLKIEFIFKIYESISKIVKPSDNFILNNDDMIFKFYHFDKNIFKSEDKFYQKFILIILLSYILKIISLKLSIKLTKYVLKEALKLDVKSREISNIYRIDSIYLVGLYYELFDHFKNNAKVRVFIGDKFDIEGFNNYSKSIEILDISFTVLINKIKENESNIENIYKEGIDFKERKKLISLFILKFLDKEINFLYRSMFLLQNLYDFIVYSKINENLIKKLPFDYRIFLEIRGCFFQYLDKEKEKEDMFFDNSADRQFFEFRNSHRANTMSLNSVLYIYPKHEKLLSNIARKNIISPEKQKNKLDNKKNTVKKKKILENSLEIRGLKKNHSLDLFMTGPKSRNNLKDTQILSKTFNKLSSYQFKSCIDSKNKNFHCDFQKNLCEKDKFSHKNASLTIYNKFIIDEDYLKDVCRDLIKNTKKIKLLNGKNQEIQPKFYKIARNYNSVNKKGNLKSAYNYFNENNAKRNIEEGLFEDLKMDRENNFKSKTLKKNNRNEKNLKEKSVKLGIDKKNMLSKFEMLKIVKFKKDFILQRSNEKQGSKNRFENIKPDNKPRSSKLNTNFSKMSIVSSVNNLMYEESKLLKNDNKPKLMVDSGNQIENEI